MHFTTDELEELIKKCQFTDDEEKILRQKNVGKSIVSMSINLNMSTASISRRIKRIKSKIKKVINN